MNAAAIAVHRAQLFMPRRARGEVWRVGSIALRILVPLLALLLEGWTALLGVLTVQEAGFWLARRLSGDQPFAARLYLGAFGLRALLATAVHAMLVLQKGSGAVFQDDGTYDLVARWLVRIGRDESLAIFVGHQHVLDQLYVYLLTGIYALLGYTPLVAKILNGVLGALAAVLVLELARRAFDRRAGRLAGVATAVLPSLVLWSIITLKEMLLLFGILVVLRALQVLASEHPRSSHAANATVALVAGLALVADVRFASFLVLAVLLPMLLLARLAPHLSPLRLAFTTVVVLGLVAGGLLFARVRYPTSQVGLLTQPEELMRYLNARRAQEAATARSDLGGAQIDALVREVLDVPAYREPEPFVFPGSVAGPMAHAILAPTPWEARGLRDLGASAEMLVWAVFLLGAFASVVARPRQPVVAGLLAVYGLGTWVLLALAEGNLGNLVRHRMMLTPAVFVLGSGGLLWGWARLQALRRYRAASTVTARTPATGRGAVTPLEGQRAQ